MNTTFASFSKKKTTITSCRLVVLATTGLLLMMLMPFHATHVVSGFAVTSFSTTPKHHPKRRRSHGHRPAGGAVSFIGGASSTTKTSSRASTTHWPLGVFSQREAEGSSFPWRSKNHTEMQSSSSSPTFTRRSSMSTTTTTSTTTEQVVHDLLRQHCEYTSDLVSLRHDMIKDAATTAAAAVAAVTMTTTTPSPLSYHAAADDDASSDSSSITVAVSTVQQQEVTKDQVQQQQDQAIVWARLLLIGAAALYGTNFSLVKVLMGSDTDIPVGLSTALRFGLAALVTSPWLFISPEQTTATTTATTYNDDDDDDDDDVEQRGAVLDATWLGLQVGMFNSIGYLSQAVGLAGTTEAGKSAFICSLAVVVVPFLDWITGRALSQREWMGAAFALAGVALLELGDGMFGASNAAAAAAAAAVASNAAGGIGMDDWISLLQPLAFGMGFFLMEKAMRKYPQHATRSTAAQLLAVFIVSILYSAVLESDTFFSATFWMETASTWLHDPNTLLFLVWTGCISTALSIYMEAVAMKTLSAAETTLILSTEPLWGAAFATVIIGEQFGINSAIGGLFIMAGCLYSSLGVKGFESFLSNIIPQQQQQLQEPKQDDDKSASFQPPAAAAAKMYTKRKQLEHYMTASMGLSSSSSLSFDKKRQKQKQQPQHQQQHHKEQQPWKKNIPQLSALAVAVAAGIIVVAEQHMGDASRVLSHQVGNFVDGIM